MAISPVTREEKILAGEEIQPKTRFEYFLKEASKQSGGGGGSAFDYEITFTVGASYSDQYAQWTSNITNEMASAIISMVDTGVLPEFKLTIDVNGEYFRGFLLSERYLNNTYQNKKTFSLSIGVMPIYDRTQGFETMAFSNVGLNGLVSTSGAYVTIEKSGDNDPVVTVTDWFDSGED